MAYDTFKWQPLQIFVAIIQDVCRPQKYSGNKIRIILEADVFTPAQL